MIITARRRRAQRSFGAAAGVCCLLAAAGATPAAQSPPPVTGTIALEGTMQKFYKAANVVIVKTIDGVEYAFTVTRNLIVHGGRDQGPGALTGLREGTTVVIHYTATGASREAKEIDAVDPLTGTGLEITEGTVIRINRRRKEITIRFAGGTSQTLRLTERAASDVGTGIAEDAAVKVFYVDEGGQKVVHYFARADRPPDSRGR